jgi:CheY-like chemotaxis protein
LADAALGDRPPFRDVRGRESVLLVDDEEPIVRMVSEHLRSLGYRITGTQSSVEALEIFQEKPDGFDIVITDEIMPVMTGTDLLQRISEIRPNLPGILSTGKVARDLDPTEREVNARATIEKPVPLSEFARTVRDVLDADALQN